MPVPPSFAHRLQRLYRALRGRARFRFDRHVSLGDLCTDRWETARHLGFGDGTSCYDNVLVLGGVKVGCHTWIGPGVVLDGSGGLAVGDYCSISAGVQIYSHHTVAWATSMGQVPVKRRATSVGSGVYIGPNSVIAMGVSIGDRAVIGAMSYVDRDVPADARVWGVPARIVSRD